MLAAADHIGVEVRVAIAGPGLDEELGPDYVSERCHDLGARRVELQLGDVVPYAAALDGDPSESSALLAASALGYSGRAEILDLRSHVTFSKRSAAVYLVHHADTLEANTLAARLTDATSLEEAESTSARLLGRSELSYERAKAAQVRDTSVADSDQLRILDSYRAGAISRGADTTTFRRLSEVLRHARYDPLRLRQMLGNTASPTVPLASLTNFPR